MELSACWAGSSHNSAFMSHHPCWSELSNDGAVLKLTRLREVAHVPLNKPSMLAHQATLAKNFSLVCVVWHYNWRTNYLHHRPWHTHIPQIENLQQTKIKDTTKTQFSKPVSLLWLCKGTGMIQKQLYHWKAPPSVDDGSQGWNPGAHCTSCG